MHPNNSKEGQLSSHVNINFVYSCTLELVSSFHVICDPSHHHNCIDWYDDAIKQIDQSLIKRIKDFGKKFAQWRLIMDLVDYYIENNEKGLSSLDDFNSIINSIKNSPEEMYIYTFLGQSLLGKREVATSILEGRDLLALCDFKELQKYMTFEDAKDFIDNRDQYKAEILSIMEEYYHSYFKERWSSKVAFYDYAINDQLKQFKSSDPLKYILNLHKNLQFTNGTLQILQESHFEIQTKEITDIKIIFSMYTFPHLMANIFNNSLTVYLNLLPPDMSTAFSEVASIPKMLGDPTRLSILKILLKSEDTTLNIARLLNMSSASISQHIKILKEAGVLTSRREKNNVYYSIEKTVLASKISSLISFLEIT